MCLMLLYLFIIIIIIFYMSLFVYCNSCILCVYVCMYVYIQVHLNKLECRGEVHLFQ